MEPNKNYQISSERDALKKTKLAWTPPFDPRFPNTNQKRNCAQNFIDFHRCQKKLGEGNEKCLYYQKAYRQLCPNTWLEKWHEQVDEGRFPVKF